MNNKGFTLIELLAIFALISIITLITIPMIQFAHKKIQENNYDAKKSVIKTAAEDYGEDYKEIILYGTDGTVDCSSYGAKCIKIKVQTLLNSGYLVRDTDLPQNVNDIRDPRDDTSLLDKDIYIYVKNNRAYADLKF